MIRPGDLLVIFSDGIVEATDADEEEFGEERLISVIAQSRRKTPAEICNDILRSVDAFLRGHAAQDDQTLVIARLQPIQTERIPVTEVELAMSLDSEVER
jgi:phosphoserine phosphatase RsbU/P